MNCEETREHLEACEDCRLHVAVEARLRTLPVVEPPKGLIDRAMRALPRVVPVKREFFRLAAAAAILIGLAVTVFATRLDQHARVQEARAKGGDFLRAAASTLNPLRSDR